MSNRSGALARRSRTGVSGTMTALAVVVVIVVAGVGGYFVGGSGATGTASTTTVMSTVSGPVSTSTFTTSVGAGATVTSTMNAGVTVTSTSTVGGAATTVTSTVTSATTALTDLEGAAQAECAKAGPTCLTIYTTQDATNWAKYYGPLFYQEYPWATGKVNYISLAAATETTRLLSEFQAKNVQADLLRMGNRSS